MIVNHNSEGSHFVGAMAVNHVRTGVDWCAERLFYSSK